METKVYIYLKSSEGTMLQQKHCWTLERVPKVISVGGVPKVTEIFPFVLDNDRDIIQIGRREEGNDMICSGAHVSRNHLQLMRKSDDNNNPGDPGSWRNIHWEVIDLGGPSGTFVNQSRIVDTTRLRDGDILGIGCWLAESSITNTSETFVYRVRAPEMLRVQEPRLEGLRISSESAEESETIKRKRKRGRQPGPGKKPLETESQNLFKCVVFRREDHGKPLYGVSFNPYQNMYGVYFATVGSNRLTLYRCKEDDIQLLQCYADPDPAENFYSCAWSQDPATSRPLVAAAGARGIVRIFSPVTRECVRSLVGHGAAVNELKFHPQVSL